MGKIYKYVDMNIFGILYKMYIAKISLTCIMDMYTQIFLIMLIDFTEYELETIANAMEDYIQYDDEKLNTESLFGGLSVADRVTSINNKIDSILYN